MLFDLEDLLGTGVSGLSVDNQESMEALKNACGDRVAISGNVLPVEVVRDGSPEDVMSAVRECIRQSGDSPRGFLLSPGLNAAMIRCRRKEYR